MTKAQESRLRSIAIILREMSEEAESLIWDILSEIGEEDEIRSEYGGCVWGWLSEARDDLGGTAEIVEAFIEDEKALTNA